MPDIKHLSGRRMAMAVEKVCIDLKNITKSYETPVLKIYHYILQIAITLQL